MHTPLLLCFVETILVITYGWVGTLGYPTRRRLSRKRTSELSLQILQVLTQGLPIYSGNAKSPVLNQALTVTRDRSGMGMMEKDRKMDRQDLVLHLHPCRAVLPIRVSQSKRAHISVPASYIPTPISVECNALDITVPGWFTGASLAHKRQGCVGHAVSSLPINASLVRFLCSFSLPPPPSLSLPLIHCYHDG